MNIIDTIEPGTILRVKHRNGYSGLVLVTDNYGTWEHNTQFPYEKGNKWVYGTNGPLYFGIFENEIVEIVAQNASLGDMYSMSHSDHDATTLKNIVYTGDYNQVYDKYVNGIISQDVFEVFCWLWRNSTIRTSEHLFQYEGNTLTKEQQLLAAPYYKHVMVYEQKGQ